MKSSSSISISDPNSAYWHLPSEELLAKTGSSVQGLTSEIARQRLAEMGTNSLETKQQETAIGLFLKQFKSPIVLILLIATMISLFVQDWTDSAIILVIVLGSAILSFVQEYNARNAAQKLKSQISVKAKVLRDGEEKSIPVEEVVVGDIVLLSAGNLIPADGVLLEAKDLFVNQAVLTGETYPVEKSVGSVARNAPLTERTNCVFMGTNVRSGSGRMLVMETGVRTTFGQITKRLTLRPPETEFERGIRKLGYLLSEVMMILVVAIFALNVFLHKPVLDSFLFSIALAVGLTPQLLPAIITINLSKGSLLMAEKGVIVRRLAAIENLGSMNILCTDKTGTLTMGVVSLDGALDPNGENSETVKRLAWLNAYFQTGMSNPLDDAILSLLREDTQAAKVDEIPYDFNRKRLSIVVQEDHRYTLITKGALEKVLEICTQLEQSGEVVPLEEDRLAALHTRYTEWSGQGYRVLGVAAKQVAEKPTYSLADESEMTFIGFLLFYDPPKPNVKEILENLESLGVSLKIITGDNKLVAAHLAAAIGLPSALILSGAELDEMSDEALWNAAERTNIFAEVNPNQKERIILALKKMGHVVGYLGDGINDAPSLHSADVGISVENAVDVAKEAADFVLLKQDLAVLEQGIRVGRQTFANTLKYIFMATSANFGNMFSMAGASLFLPFLPMLPKQILLINFLTDLPEMTIASDQVDEVLIQKPHRWNIDFIRRFMLIFGPLSSIYDYATFGLLLWIMKANQQAFHTGWFIESVLSASMVVFAIRTRLPFQHSRPSRFLLTTTIGVAAITLFLPYSPFASLLGFTPLPLFFLLLIFGIVLIYFLSAEWLKHWFYRRFHE